MAFFAGAAGFGAGLAGAFPTGLVAAIVFFFSCAGVAPAIGRVVATVAAGGFGAGAAAFGAGAAAFGAGAAGFGVATVGATFGAITLVAISY